MVKGWRIPAASIFTAVVLALCLPLETAWAQEPDEATVIKGIDAAVQRRYENVLGFTDIEHYSVFRNQDETHSIADMTVKDTYRKGVGKTYTVLSESGSELARKFGLQPLINSETLINQPGHVEHSWFNSSNYEMKLKPGGIQRLNGRDCYVLAVIPKHKATSLIDGTLWVDANNYAIVKLEGTASKNPSILAGAAQMMREYMSMSGFPMARHARAESNSIVGHIVVTIDYSDYQLELRAH